MTEFRVRQWVELASKDLVKVTETGPDWIAYEGGGLFGRCRYEGAEPLTLHPGDGCKIGGMTEGQFYSVFEAFKKAGADMPRYPTNNPFAVLEGYKYLSWLSNTEGYVALRAHEQHRIFRLLTIEQIISTLSGDGDEAEEKWGIADDGPFNGIEAPEKDYDFIEKTTDPKEAGFNLYEFLNEQRKFSLATFGPISFKNHKGPLDHILRELKEIEEAPDDVFEWVDLILLSFDGAMRAGHGQRTICKALQHKLKINKARDWPDWRNTDPDKAIEHIREKEEITPEANQDNVLSEETLVKEIEGHLLVAQKSLEWASTEIKKLTAEVDRLEKDNARMSGLLNTPEGVSVTEFLAKAVIAAAQEWQDTETAKITDGQYYHVYKTTDDLEEGCSYQAIAVCYGGIWSQAIWAGRDYEMRRLGFIPSHVSPVQAAPGAS